jgi:hypothetical protein
MTEGIDIRDCQAYEALLCDYVDGTLAPDARAGVEAHLACCAACADYARDARQGFEFLRDTDPVEPPPALVNRILYQIPTKSSSRTGLKGWLGRLFEPVMQPRVVMGAMMTVFSLAVMTRCAGVPSRTLSTSDLDPVKIWGSIDDRLHRTWDRTVKTYESMRVVYEIRSRLNEWKQQSYDQDAAAADAAAQEAVRTRELPARPTGSSGTGSDRPASKKK